MQQLDASHSSATHRGFQQSDDVICVFLNFKLIGKFKDKQSANQCIIELLSKGPKEAQKDFSEYKHLLLC
jgi:hypothetical protein